MINRPTIVLAVTIVLNGGLWGCTVASNQEPNPEITPDASATLHLALLTSTAEASQSSTLEPSIDPPAQLITISTPEVIDPPTETGITLEEASQLMPLHPSQVTVEANEEIVVLKWLGTGEDIIQYEIYRKTSDVMDWQQLISVIPTEYNSGWYEFRDATTEPGNAYIYGITAIDAYGNESLISESVAITSK